MSLRSSFETCEMKTVVKNPKIATQARLTIGNIRTNLSLEDGFDCNASNEVEPDDVKSLQHQQQPIQ